MLPEIVQKREPCRCGRNLTCILDESDLGPDVYLCWWRERRATKILPEDSPMTLSTINYCPSCKRELPYLVYYRGDDPWFFDSEEAARPVLARLNLHTPT